MGKFASMANTKDIDHLMTYPYEMNTHDPTASVTLLTVPREVGITRGTRKKYLTYLGIEPICFHIGTRSLYISREAMTQVAHLKENPALHAHLPSPVFPQASEERKADDDEKRKDPSDAL